MRLCVAAWAILAICVAHLAQAEEKDRLTADLLRTCWERSDAAQTQTDEKFALLAKSADARAHYAHALVLMYQRRFEESLESLDLALGEKEYKLSASQAKVWLAVLTKNYGVAFPAMEEMAKSAAEAAREGQKETAQEAARFLGSVYGYLDGPLGDSTATAGRKGTEKRMLAALSESEREVFTVARQEVIEKYTALINERQDTREAKIAADDADKTQTLAEIDQRRTEMQTEANELKERRDQVAGELKEELAEIARLDRPLVAQLAQLQAEAALLQRSLNSVLLDIDRLERDFAREEDEIRRDRLRFEIDRLRPLVRRYDIDLAIVNRAAAPILAQRAELAGRQATAQSNLGGQLQAIDRKFSGLQAAERKLAGSERRASKPSTGRTGGVTGLGVTATALKTYEPFLIERERARLLDELR